MIKSNAFGGLQSNTDLRYMESVSISGFSVNIVQWAKQIKSALNLILKLSIT
jgi:hypothetical protein